MFIKLNNKKYKKKELDFINFLIIKKKNLFKMLSDCLKLIGFQKILNKILCLNNPFNLKYNLSALVHFKKLLTAIEKFIKWWVKNFFIKMKVL